MPEPIITPTLFFEIELSCNKDCCIAWSAAKIAKAALKNKTTLKTEALKSGLIKEKDYDKIVDPKKMIYPS